MKNGVSQSYLNWNVDRYSYLDLIELYVNHLHSMAGHTFMATWNYCQFKRARTNIKPGELLLVNDFAQNYLCLLQNEPQGLHWEHKHVTLHPTVAYYTCPNDHCAMTVSHELVHMSEDLMPFFWKHRSPAENSNFYQKLVKNEPVYIYIVPIFGLHFVFMSGVHNTCQQPISYWIFF